MRTPKPITDEALIERILGNRDGRSYGNDLHSVLRPFHALLAQGFKIVRGTGGVSTARKGPHLFHASIVVEMKTPDGLEMDMTIEWEHPHRKQIEG